MRRLAGFLKATTLGGLFVVLPVVVVVALLGKAVIAVRAGAQSLMETVGGEGSHVTQFPLIYALLLVIGISLAFGLAMTSRRGLATGHWLERRLLFRLPWYAAIRAIVGGLGDATREGAVKSGLLTVDPGIEAFVFVIEDHGNGLLTVYIPGSPNPASGNVQIVHKDLVRLLNVRMTAITSVLQQWGMGSAKVLAKDSAAMAIAADVSARDI
ncbi:MAG TPA: hypothetical protein VK678_13355 [Bradyrhizobium sp.]|nr:hypothetical protein [Bradyrhizobium sp.]